MLIDEQLEHAEKKAIEMRRRWTQEREQRLALERDLRELLGCFSLDETVIPADLIGRIEKKLLI